MEAFPWNSGSFALPDNAADLAFKEHEQHVARAGQRMFENKNEQMVLWRLNVPCLSDYPRRP